MINRKTFDTTLDEQLDTQKLLINASASVTLQACIEFDANESIASLEFIDNVADIIGEVAYFCRWSLDEGVNWSMWQIATASIGDLNEILLAHFSQGCEVLLQMRIDVQYAQNWKLDESKSNAYELTSIRINDIEVDECVFMVEDLSPEHDSIIQKSEDRLFNPYERLESPVETWKQMVYAANRQIGHVVIWFSHFVTDEHKVAALRSFDLIHTGDVKFLQLMVVDNNFNVDKVTYDAFDIDFEQGIEVHITPEAYEKVFGAGKMPMQHDYFYAPVANRMFEVTSVEKELGLMNAIGWYKCQCRSYEIRTDLRDKSQMTVDDTVSSMLADHSMFDDGDTVLNVDNLVNNMKDFDAKAVTQNEVATSSLNMFVTDTHIDVSLFDATRSWIAAGALSTPTKVLIENGSVPIASAVYDFSKCKTDDVAIEYIKSLTNDKCAFGMWFMLNEESRYVKSQHKMLAKVGNILIATQKVGNNQLIHLYEVASLQNAQEAINQIAFIKLSEPIVANVWHQIILRLEQFEDICHVCVTLCKLKDVGSLDKVFAIDKADTQVSMNMCIANQVVKPSVQLYTFNGFATHIRLDETFDIGTRKLLCFEQSYESTLIADDASQIEIAGKQIIDGKGNWHVNNPNDDEVCASDAWSKELKAKWQQMQQCKIKLL